MDGPDGKLVEAWNRDAGEFAQARVAELTARIGCRFWARLGHAWVMRYDVRKPPPKG